MLLGANYANISAPGLWVETYIPTLPLAPQVDVALGLLVVIMLGSTCLYALLYPRRVWINAYSSASPRAILPGLWTGFILCPMVGFLWFASQGGSLLGMTPPTTFQAFLFLSLSVPSVAGTLLVMQEHTLRRTRSTR